MSARAFFAAIVAAFATPRLRDESLTPQAITQLRHAEGEVIVSPHTERRTLRLFDAWRMLKGLGR